MWGGRGGGGSECVFELPPGIIMSYTYMLFNGSRGRPITLVNLLPGYPAVWLLNTAPQLLHHGLYFRKLEYERLYYLTEVLKQVPGTPALSV